MNDRTEPHASGWSHYLADTSSLDPGLVARVQKGEMHVTLRKKKIQGPVCKNCYYFYMGKVKFSASKKIKLNTCSAKKGIWFFSS